MDIPAPTGSAPRVSLLSASLRDHEYGRVPVRIAGGPLEDAESGPSISGGFGDVSMSLGRSPFFRAPPRSTPVMMGSSFTAGHSFIASSHLRQRHPHGADSPLTTPLLSPEASTPQLIRHDSATLANSLSRPGSYHHPPAMATSPGLTAAAASLGSVSSQAGVSAFTTALPVAADAAGSFAAPGAPGLPAAAVGRGRDAAAAADKQQQAAGQVKAAAARTNAIIFGLINAIVGIPTMISFAAIVYQDAVYSPLLGQLARFSFFSAAMHQLAFTIFSTLPFAVGQPQDVGLIFLSAMATSVAEIGRKEGLGEDVIVGTALLTLTLATLLVGLLTWLVAKFKLATLVQYVPLPVVGGYLGYVGYFCLAAGVGLGTSTHIEGFATWTSLFAKDAAIKLVPTLVAAFALLWTMSHAKNPWALPVLLGCIPAAFHVWLAATGTSLADAQDAGWVLKPEGKSTQQFWELYELFNIKDLSLDGVYLPALVRQLPKMLGLFFVVTFGSCLDVAAIQADLPEPIDFNSELATVGLSNVVVGLSGSGYTGSYIFSQTIFSMRAGVNSWVHGAVIAGLEGLIFFLPYSVVQYLPNFFFGALLVVFGVEISGDWLVRSYTKVTPVEYGLLLATFLAIMQFELQAGVAIGVLLCTLCFAFTYAKVNMTSFSVLPSRSAAVRSYQERQLLDALGARLAAVRLSGYMFFGSGVLLSDKVVSIAEDMMAAGGRLSMDGNAAVVVRGSSRTWEQQQRVAAFAAQAPAFVLLDFRRVLGVDATAAQTLGTLVMVLRRMGVELVLTRVTSRTMRRLFVAHGLIHPRDGPQSLPGGSGSSSGGGEVAVKVEGEEGEEEYDEGLYCRVFDTLNDGSQYAEDRLLDLAMSAGVLALHEEALTLEELVDRHLGPTANLFLNPHGDTSPGGHSRSTGLLPAAAAAAGGGEEVAPAAAAGVAVDVGAVTRGLLQYVQVQVFSSGKVLYDFEEPANHFYLVLKGAVSLQVRPQVQAWRTPNNPSRQHQQQQQQHERHFQSGPGAVVGSTDFVLQTPRSFRAVAAVTCQVAVVSREAFQRMSRDNPQALTGLQMILLRDACLSEVYAYEVMERDPDE